MPSESPGYYRCGDSTTAGIGGAGFQKEGTFTASMVMPGDAPETLPQPVSIELFDDGEDDASLAAAAGAKRKRKRKAGTAPEKGFGQ